MGDRLRALRLGAMADRWERQSARLDERPAEERLAELLEAQESLSADRALQRGHKRARVPQSQTRLGEVWYRKGRGLTRELMASLASLEWVHRHRHVVVLGDTGRGKTWLTCALANAAIQVGGRVRYAELPVFLAEWHEHEAAQSLARFYADLSKLELLVIDRWAEVPVSAGEVLMLEELVRAREGKTTFVLASSVAVDLWPAWLGGGHAAAAIVDRLCTDANIVKLGGPSLRSAAQAVNPEKMQV